MASPQAEAIREMMRSAPSTFGASLEEQRATAELVWPSVATDPQGVRFDAVDVAGVPGEWAMPEGAADDRVLMYLHGGGYTLGSIATHRKLVGHLAKSIGCRALSLDYRLAPEHPFPAAIDDATAGFRWLIDQGIASGHVVIAGDSAGGGLTVATMLNLRDTGRPLPAAAVLLSPWTDLEGTGESMTSRRDVDVFIDPGDLTSEVARYTGGRDPRDPLISAIYADLTGLPPLLIHVGDHEVLLDDSTRLCDVAKNAGVEVSIEIWPEMLHVFQAAVGTVPESDASVAAIASWVRERLALD